MKKFRDREIAARILREIRGLYPNRRVKFMHVCGSHEVTITKFEGYDVHKKFDFQMGEVEDFAGGCRCGDVLMGLIHPRECPLFNEACTPEHPVGPCAVTTEGACNIRMKHPTIAF